MKSKQLFTLIVITAALLLGAFFVQRSKQPNTPTLGTVLFPDLRVNDILRVEITSSESQAVLTRQNDVWVSESRYGYPIRFDTLRDALMLLTTLDAGQPVTLSDEQRKALSLLPPSTNPAAHTGTRIAWFYNSDNSAKGEPAGSIIVGQEHHKNIPGVSEQYGGYPDGQFIALDHGANNGTVYLSPELLERFSPIPEMWLVNELLNIPADSIKAVTLRYTDEDKTMTLPRREGTSSLMVTDLKKKEVEVSEKLTSVSSALSYFTLADVADPALTDDAMGFTNAAGFEAETDAGIRYTVTIGGKTPDASQNYIRLAASLIPQTSTNTPGTNALPATSEEPSPDQTVKEFNSKVGSWTFLVPSYKVESMQLKRADLVSKKDEEAEKNDDD